MAQPEVGVIQRAGDNLSKDKNLYPTYDKHGKLINPIAGHPVLRVVLPVLPADGRLRPAVGRDAQDQGPDRPAHRHVAPYAAGERVWRSDCCERRPRRRSESRSSSWRCRRARCSSRPVATTCRSSRSRLLGVVALQRRQNNFAGISLGLAAAMKLTAWPMAFGALLVARDAKNRSAWMKIAAWVVAIVVVTVTPFAIRAPWAFMSNVFAFPLGLTSVTSPAASALPGHIS